MDFSMQQTHLLELDELKSDTTTTRKIQEDIRMLMNLEGQKKKELETLVTQILNSYDGFLKKV